MLPGGVLPSEFAVCQKRGRASSMSAIAIRPEHSTHTRPAQPVKKVIAIYRIAI